MGADAITRHRDPEVGLFPLRADGRARDLPPALGLLGHLLTVSWVGRR